MNRCDCAYKKGRRTGKTQLLSAYKRLRNSTTKSIRETYSNLYLDEVMSGIDPNPIQAGTSTGVKKKAWSYLKLLCKESTGIPTIFWNKCVCASNQSKAKALWKKYESMLTREGLTILPDLPGSPYGKIDDINFSAQGMHK